MHIAVNKRNGIPYASVMTSVREGKTVKKKSVMYLGRVLDRDRGIYKSVERGVFAYDLDTNTISEAPADFVPQVRRKNARPTLENSYLRERCSQTREHPRFLFT